jgi:hypothetical protein
MAGRLLKVVDFWLHAKNTTDVDSTPNNSKGVLYEIHIKVLLPQALATLSDFGYPV